METKNLNKYVVVNGKLVSFEARRAAVEKMNSIREARLASEQEAQRQEMKMLLAQGYSRQEAAMELRAEKLSGLEARGFGQRKRIRVSSVRA